MPPAIKVLLACTLTAMFISGGCETLIRRDDSAEQRQADVTAVQSEVMSFTDTFISAIAQAWNSVSLDARVASDPSGLASFNAETDLPSRQRRAALHNKLANASAALAIASSPNPYVAVADLVTMVTLQRMVLEAPSAMTFYGPKNGPALVETYREQEARAWRMAEQTMPAQQRQALADLIAEWRAQHPNDTYVSSVRLEDFAGARQQTILARKDSRGNLLSLVWLDPFANLDPAEREVQKTRLLGERMFYYASRSPQILKWHVETLYQDLLSTPEFKQSLASVEQVSDAASRISSVAEELPAHVAAERSAALNQFFDQLAVERQNTVEQISRAATEQREALVRQLDESQGQLQGTLKELNSTAETMDRMAGSLTTAINAADAFAARFESDPGDPPDEDSDPLGDFRLAAAQAGEAADRLTILATQLNELMNAPAVTTDAPGLRGLVQQASTSARDVVTFAFWRLLVLCLATPFAIVLAMLLYRALVRAMFPPRAP